jgi:putative transposase
MAYVLLHDGMQQYSSLEAVLKAQDYMGIGFKTVQTDNGPEFGKKFQDEIRRRGMNYRHIRVRRPNDNAHIERFNRTLREECLGNYFPSAETLKHTQKRLSSWLDYYNYKRLHLGLQCRVPANVAKVLR